tara:strand:+ start:1240 stop:1515 length:276 start_codon:yes stop_codon:yes gene_type:complete
MSTQEERMVGENVRLRSKLKRALAAEAAVREERRALARRMRSYSREVLELETTIVELRGRLGANAKEFTKLRKYEALIKKMVERVQKDSRR